MEVSELRPSTRQEVVSIKEMKTPKTYDVSIAFGIPVPKEKLKKGVCSLDGAQITQFTPSRVAHRRAKRDRIRKVLSCDIREHTPDTAVLRVTGESGIYIKELIHGDGGQTRPNLSEILETPCRVTARDVVWIHDTDREIGSNGTITPDRGEVSTEE